MPQVGDYFADLLRPRWAAGLNKVTIPNVAGVESWLLSGKYNWLPSPAGAVHLDASAAKDSLAQAVASEVARFSCATYESLLDASPREHEDRALGWALIRYYYATFYAAHALLRLSGKSITMIAPQTASTLKRVGGQYLGVSPQLENGLHIIEIDSINRSKIVIRKIGSGNGGSHEDMWRVFLKLVKDLEDQLVLTQGQSQPALAAVQVLVKLRTQLCQQGKASGAWLSSVRNSLNYRHEYGVWYPYTLTSKAASGLLQRMNRWGPSDPNGFDIGLATNDLEWFIDSCNVTTRLLTAALNDLSSRAVKSRSSFVDRQPFKLLRLRRVNV